MSKNNHDEPKEELEENLSEWQKRNKEYLEKKAQEEEEKHREEEEELAERAKQAAEVLSDHHEADEESVSDEGEEPADTDGEAEEVSAESVADGAELEELPYEDELDPAAEEPDEEAGPPLSKKEARRLAKEKRKAEKAAAKVAMERSHIYRALPVLLTSGLIFLISLYFLTPLATMKTLEFSGNQVVPAETLLKSSKVDDRDYTLTTLFNQSKYAKNMKDASPWIEDLTMHYQFPTTFKVDVKEYGVLAYLHEGDQYFPVLMNGHVIEEAAAADSLPENFISIEFSDRKFIEEFAKQLAAVPDSIKSGIRTVQLTPSQVTPDLVTLIMDDENKILVPISHIKKKLHYYAGIKPQLDEPSIVDMEAGIFSYVEGANSSEAEKKTQERSEDQPQEEGENPEEAGTEPAAEAENPAENTGNAENR